MTKIEIDYDGTPYYPTYELKVTFGIHSTISFTGQYLTWDNGVISIWGQTGGSGYGYSKAKEATFSYPLAGVELVFSDEYRKNHQGKIYRSLR